jgi:hypothetical protein
MTFVPKSGSLKSEKLLPLISAFLILTFLIGSYFATGPLLEGYQIEFFSRNHGYVQFFPSIILRPLSVLPNWFAIGISRSGLNGYWAISFALILIRALSITFLKNYLGRFFWPILIFAIFLPTWPASLNERFLPAQLACTLLLLAYAFTYIRKVDTSIVFILVLLSCLSYPTLIFVPVAIYILQKSWIFVGIESPKKNSFPIFLGIGVFVCMLLLVKRLVPVAYDAQAAGRPNLRALEHVYLTALTHYPTYSIAVLMILFSFIAMNHASNVKSSITAIGITIILPITSFTYSGNIFHVNDPERILFPITVALLMILIEIAISSGGSQAHVNSTYLILLFIAVSSLLTFWTESTNIKTMERNREVVANLNQALASHKHKSKLIVQDYSGKLGDINSFFADSLKDAIKPSARIDSAEICLPKGIKAKQEIIKRYPLPGPLSCSLLPSTGEFSVIEISPDWKVKLR